MYKHKLCLATGDRFGVSVCEQIKMFRLARFDGFFIGWREGCDIVSWKKAADECGMLYQSVHAPFGGSADMWYDDEDEAEKAERELIKCLRDCARVEVPIMVAHVFIGFDDEETMPNEKGLTRYGRVISEAEKLGVKIAFENTEGERFLDAIFKNFSSSPAVGFCWDSGHEMCYNRSRNLLADYGGKLIATHLNDNLGISDYDGKIYWTDDLHLLPFDGIADWPELAVRLRKCGFDGPLTFELNKSSKPDRYDNSMYEKMPAAQYIAACYNRACRVASLLER